MKNDSTTVLKFLLNFYYKVPVFLACLFLGLIPGGRIKLVHSAVIYLGDR
jgi:hypothetical protein